jgi:quinol monooxygenase YgiN
MQFTIEMRANPEKAQEFYQTLQAILTTIRKEKGCRNCRVYRDVEDGRVFILSVYWKDPVSLEQYIASDSGGALLGAIDLLGETARVQIGRNAPWEGIETLKRMRKNV